MRIIEDHQAISDLPKGMVLTIGNFDGVHRGHQSIIATARQIARDKQAQLAVMTFDPHPAVLLNPDRVPGILTPLKMKALLLESLSVDVLIVIKDSLKLLNLSPEDFVDQFLVENLSPAVMVEGPDFNFGYFRLVGKTIPGRGVGAKIGFPTANIDPIGQVIPAEGVYAGYVVVGECLEDVVFGGLRRPAAISIGRAKTFLSDHPLLLEAHLLEDNVEDLRNKWLGLDFMRFVRHQQRYESKDDLKKQIQKDCDKALNYLI
jgi:riboflavin kinase/FMN adenylyltransferase